MCDQTLDIKNVHPFQESNPNTVGPYTFLYVVKGGRGMCEHCGRGIKYHCHIQDSNGFKFVVGTSCVLKTGDKRVGTPMEIKLKELKRQEQWEKRQAKEEARRIAYLNEIMPSGKTRQQEQEEHAKMEEQQKEEKRKLFFQKWGEVMEVLQTANGEFARSVLEGLNEQNEPFGRGKIICCEIYAKSFGRRGSKKYEEALEYMENKLEV